MVIQTSRAFAGPLPPPELLNEYEMVLPGSAERIISMAESQQRHRQTLEHSVINSNVEAQSRGTVFGFIVAMTAILGGIFLIYVGKQTGGLVAIIGALTGLVGTFIYSKYQQKKELEEKSRGLQQR